MNQSETIQPKRTRLTKRLVDARRTTHVKGKRERVWDTEVTDLFLQITPNGSASYCIRYKRADGKPRDFTLASADLVAPEQVREAAIRRLAALTLDGVDPAVAKRKALEEAKTARTNTFESLVTKFDEMHPDFSDSDKETRRYYMARYILPRLGKRHFKDITVEEVRALVRDVQVTIAKGEIAQRRGWRGYDGANLCQFLVRRIFNWAIEERWATENPAAFDPIFEHIRETRFEKFDDINFRAVWQVFYDRVVSGRVRINAALAILLALTTLQRPVDVVRARRQDVDFEKSLWIVPKHMTKKKKKPYYVPLSPLSKQLFVLAFGRHNEELGFPSIAGRGRINRSSMTTAVRETVNELHAAGTVKSRDIQLYDGRRFGRTKIEYDLDYGERIAELVINHFDENNASRIYNVHDYRKDIQEAQNAWGAEIQRMVGGTFEELFDGSVTGSVVTPNTISHLAGDSPE